MEIRGQTHLRGVFAEDAVELINLWWLVGSGAGFLHGHRFAVLVAFDDVLSSVRLERPYSNHHSHVFNLFIGFRFLQINVDFSRTSIKTKLRKVKIFFRKVEKSRQHLETICWPSARFLELTGILKLIALYWPLKFDGLRVWKAVFCVYFFICCFQWKISKVLNRKPRIFCHLQ